MLLESAPRAPVAAAITTLTPRSLLYIISAHPRRQERARSAGNFLVMGGLRT